MATKSATKKSASNKSAAPSKATASKKSAPAKKAAAPASKSASGRNSGASKKSAAPKKGGRQAQPVDERSMLTEFFIDSLKDIYWAEKHIVKTLPKMQKAATSQELKTAFEEHTAVSQEQAERLEEVFQLMGQKAQGKKCAAIEGITEEGKEIIEETQKGTATRDVGLIMAAQKVEHYEIATYGSLVQLARTLGLDDVAELLETTLNEEKETDMLLTQIAETSVNIEAAGEDEDEEDDSDEDDTEDEEN